MKELTTLYVKLYQVLATDNVKFVSTDSNGGYFAIVERLVEVVEPEEEPWWQSNEKFSIDNI